MTKPISISALGAICLAIAVPARAQGPAAPAASADSADSPFVVTALAFSACLKRIVQMGMMTKMDPVAFKAGFAKSCEDEEARFRAEGVKEAVRQGRSQAEAVREIEGNIANGRRNFAGHQESYFRTGRVPR